MEKNVVRSYPRDPRSRAVTDTVKAGGASVAMRLECGHEMRRRSQCPLSRVICHECTPGPGPVIPAR